MGKEIAKAMEQPLNELQNDLLDYAKTAFDVEEVIRKVITSKLTLPLLRNRKSPKAPQTSG